MHDPRRIEEKKAFVGEVTERLVSQNCMMEQMLNELEGNMRKEKEKSLQAPAGPRSLSKAYNDLEDGQHGGTAKTVRSTTASCLQKSRTPWVKGDMATSRRQQSTAESKER